MKKRFINDDSYVTIIKGRNSGGSNQMTHWKLLEKLKPQKIFQSQTPSKNLKTSDESSQRNTKPSGKTVLAEYHETLHTRPSSGNWQASVFGWRNIETIEENIDSLSTIKNTSASSEIEKRVDHLLAKKHKK